MTIITLPKKFNEYNPKTLKHLQDVYLMMLKDFIKVCDENQIDTIWIAAVHSVL